MRPSLAERLQRLAALATAIERQHPPSAEERFERRMRAVYGNLGIERPELTLAEVRRVLRGQRP